MSGIDKRIVILLIAAVLIISGSLYGYNQKMSPPANIAPQVSPNDNFPNKSEVIIYISGAVAKPGVYKIQPNSRILDAVNIAGGLSPGADSGKINLAMPVKDGMHINIPGALSEKSKTGKNDNTSSAVNQAGKININIADKKELDKLPGIGPALAERIVEYRQTHGLFTDPAEIKKVPGIGEAKYNQIKDKISI